MSIVSHARPLVSPPVWLQLSDSLGEEISACYYSNMGFGEVLFVKVWGISCETGTQNVLRLPLGTCKRSQQLERVSALKRLDTIMCFELGIDVFDMRASSVH